MRAPAPRSTLFPYTTLFRSESSRSSCLCNCGYRLLFVSMAREVFHLTDHQRGPAGLMAGAQSLAGFAVEIFVEQNQVDRKSTRLNSSHRCISYAVFCLKKEK